MWWSKKYTVVLTCNDKGWIRYLNRHNKWSDNASDAHYMDKLDAFILKKLCNFVMHSMDSYNTDGFSAEIKTKNEIVVMDVIE